MIQTHEAITALANEPIVVVGLGSVGRRHLANLIELGCRNLILVRTGKGPGRYEGDLTEFLTVTELEAALQRKPRAAVIANPTALHAASAARFLEAGVDVFIEKPVSHSMDDCTVLEAHAARTGAIVVVGFQFRFHPSLRQLREWLRDESIGRPVAARAEWGEYLPGWHPDEDYRDGYSAKKALGGGVINTLSHPIDYLMWFLGPISSVGAHAGRISDLDIDVEDTAAMLLQFRSGIIGSLTVDYVQRPPSHRITIVGTQGTIWWDARDGVVRMYDARTDDWHHHSPPDSFQRNDMFLAEMKHFLQCVQNRDQPVCTLEHGALALKVALAAHESARTGSFVNV